MPNGGFPRIVLITPPGGTGLCLRGTGPELGIGQAVTTPAGGRRIDIQAALTPKQVQALLSHLLYWAAGSSLRQVLESEGYSTRHIHFHTRGVAYDL